MYVHCRLVLLQDLKQQGYNVGDIPEKEEDLIKSVLNDPEVRIYYSLASSFCV
jgi:hypothetical protein